MLEYVPTIIIEISLGEKEKVHCPHCPHWKDAFSAVFQQCEGHGWSVTCNFDMWVNKWVNQSLANNTTITA